MRSLAFTALRAVSGAHARSERVSSPVSLSIPKDPALVAAVRLAAAGVGLRAGLTFESIEDVKIIVAEACTYCMRCSDPAGRIRITFEIHPKAFVILVADPLFRFSASQNWNGAALGSPDELFIIRGLADELEYRTRVGNGLVMRITKSRL